MPLISSSTYKASAYLKGRAHLQTVLPSVFRRLYPASYTRERLELPDGDFLDIDWMLGLNSKSERAVIVCHGLEGSSKAPYAKGIARVFASEGWDVALMNFRSCSGELNRLSRSYHSGETEDLSTIFEHVLKKYQEVALVGFSLGGNVILKYLGEKGGDVSAKIKGAVTFSVPCDLAGSGATLTEPGNKFYMTRFLRMLEKKVRQKHLRGDAILSADLINNMNSFWEFDDAYTAPLHGFNGADDYYNKSSSKQFLSKITVPTLLINAKNDPFLSEECFPVEEAKGSSCFYLEMPAEGGHCGFPTAYLLGTQWHESRALDFLSSIL